jgi:hypothetical protein
VRLAQIVVVYHILEKISVEFSERNLVSSARKQTQAHIRRESLDLT